MLEVALLCVSLVVVTLTLRDYRRVVGSEVCYTTTLFTSPMVLVAITAIATILSHTGLIASQFVRVLVLLATIFVNVMNSRIRHQLDAGDEILMVWAHMSQIAILMCLLVFGIELLACRGISI